MFRDLDQFSARVLHLLPFDSVRERLAALGLVGIDARFWEAVRPNLATLADARDWWAVCRAPLAGAIEEPDFARVACGLLPPEPWDAGTWAAWTGAVSAATGRKGKALYRPLRLALTAREHGPELKTLLPLLGRERVLARLGGETA